MSASVPAEMWQEPTGGWRGRVQGDPGRTAAGASRRECLDALRRAAAELDGTLVVTERPQLVGVAEAAAILGWDKRRIVTYVDRGRFPEPLARLAGGRVWRREDVEVWAREWRERRKGRRAAGPSG